MHSLEGVLLPGQLRVLLETFAREQQRMVATLTLQPSCLGVNACTKLSGKFVSKVEVADGVWSSQLGDRRTLDPSTDKLITLTDV